MPSNKVPSSVVKTSTSPAPVAGGGGAEALISHLTDAVGAHAASAISYDGGPTWADGTTNPAGDVETQLDKNISDLADTTASTSGARKIGMEATTVGTVVLGAEILHSRLVNLQSASNISYSGGGAWADATTNPATDVEAQVDKIISDLSASSGTGGAGKVGLGARSNWLDGKTNVSTDVWQGIQDIIVDLGSFGSGNDAMERIGAFSHTSSGSFGVIASGTARTQIDILFDNAVHLTNNQTISGQNTYSGNSTFSGTNTHSGAFVEFSGAQVEFSGTDVDFTGTRVNMAALLTVTGDFLKTGVNTFFVEPTANFDTAVAVIKATPQALLHVGDTTATGSHGDAIIGNASLGTMPSDSGDCYFGHIDFAPSTSQYALRMSNFGDTRLNAITGQEIFFQIGGTSRGVVDAQGEFGIGTTAPTFKLEVVGSDGNASSPPTVNEGLVKFHYNVNNFPKQTLVLEMSDPAGGTNDVFVGFFNDTGRVGSIHSEVIYGTFTGEHPTPIPKNSKYDGITMDEGSIPPETGSEWVDEPSLREGMILVTDGIWYRKSTSNALPYTKVSTVAKDPKVFGVWGGWEGADLYGTGVQTYMTLALGEGQILVTDTNGNIAAGDFICTSDRYGHGEKQDDDLLHNYTVAKATEDIDFSTVSVDPELGFKSVLMACTYHSG